MHFPVETLYGLDQAGLGEQPRRGGPAFTRRVAAVVMAINFLASRGRLLASAADIRAVIDFASGKRKPGRPAAEQGNEWVGLILGVQGFGFPRMKEKHPKRYRLPEGGVTREMIEAVYTVPAGWDWDAQFQWTEDEVYDHSGPVTAEQRPRGAVNGRLRGGAGR